MAFDMTGKLYKVFDTVQVSERFSKRDFVLEVQDGKYPQLVSFQATGDRTSALDEYRVGDEVRVTFNVRGREWTSPKQEVKYFNTLDVWKVEGTRQSRSSGGTGGGGGSTQSKPDDDIPF
jgi:hypothetical protein